MITFFHQWQKTPILQFGRGLYYQDSKHKLQTCATWNTASLPLLIKSIKNQTEVGQEEEDNLMDE